MGQGLGLSDVTQGIDDIFLAETWVHDTKHIPMIYGLSLKGILEVKG